MIIFTFVNLIFFFHQIETSRNDEREDQIQSLEKENQMLRETISQLETKQMKFNFNSFSNYFLFSIEEINREKHALSDTNDSISRDLAKIDAEKLVI